MLKHMDKIRELIEIEKKLKELEARREELKRELAPFVEKSITVDFDGERLSVYKTTHIRIKGNKKAAEVLPKEYLREVRFLTMDKKKVERDLDKLSGIVEVIETVAVRPTVDKDK